MTTRQCDNAGTRPDRGAETPVTAARNRLGMFSGRIQRNATF